MTFEEKIKLAFPTQNPTESQQELDKRKSVDNKQLFLKLLGGQEGLKSELRKWQSGLVDSSETAQKLDNKYENKDSFKRQSNVMKSYYHRGRYFTSLARKYFPEIELDVYNMANEAFSYGSVLENVSDAYSAFKDKEEYDQAQKDMKKYLLGEYAQKYSGIANRADHVHMILNKQNQMREHIINGLVNGTGIDMSFVYGGEADYDKTDWRATGNVRDIEENPEYYLPAFQHKDADPRYQLITEEEYQWLEDYMELLDDERLERAEIRQQMSREEEYLENAKPIIEMIDAKADKETQEMINEYIESDDAGALKTKIKRSLKEQGFKSNDINDILEYASGERNRRKLMKTAEDLAESNFFEKLFATQGAILSFIPGGIASFVDNTWEAMTGGYNNPYAGGNYLNQWSSTVTSAISQDIEIEAFKDIYDFGVSTLQSITTIALSAAIGTAVGYAAGPTAGASVAASATKLISMPLLYVTSSGQKMTDTITRGGTTGQAVLLGNIAGAIEMGTEKLPLDNLLKITSSKTLTQSFTKKIFSDGLSQMPEEFAGEFISQFSDFVVDATVMADKSLLSQMYNEYVSNGYSGNQAAASVFINMLTDSACAGISGAAAGFLTGGGASAVSQSFNNIGLSFVGKTVRSYESENGLDGFLINTARDLNISHTEIGNVLNKMLSKSKLTDADVGRVYRIVSSEVYNRLHQQVKSAVGDRSNANEIADSVMAKLTSRDISLMQNEDSSSFAGAGAYNQASASNLGKTLQVLIKMTEIADSKMALTDKDGIKSKQEKNDGNIVDNFEKAIEEVFSDPDSSQQHFDDSALSSDDKLNKNTEADSSKSAFSIIGNEWSTKESADADDLLLRRLLNGEIGPDQYKRGIEKLRAAEENTYDESSITEKTVDNEQELLYNENKSSESDVHNAAQDQQQRGIFSKRERISDEDFQKSLDDYAQRYSELVNSNCVWSWKNSVNDGYRFTIRQKRDIKRYAIEKGYIVKVPVIARAGLKFGFADFESVGVVKETVFLPESLWKETDYTQNKWLNEQIGGAVKGYTWHHTEVPGKMQLVPMGIHNITSHNGGRTAGMWAYAPRRRTA